MLRQSITITACVAALAGSPLIHADTFNGPDPYGAGLGFDRPDDATAATWGGWTRGSAGTIWAEWDQFNGAPNPASPDIGSSGTPSATFGWNPGTFATSTTGNLYNFSGLQVFSIAVDGSQGPTSGPVTVALQTETWGSRLEFDAGEPPAPVAPVTLNGAQWDSKTITFQQSDFPSTFGPVLLEQVLFTWTLDGPLASFDFVLQGGPHISFAQAAVDIGPSPVPVPAAVWLLGSAVTGLVGVARRKRAS